MTNFGAHHIDIAHWGLGMDESGPLSVEGTGVFHPEGWVDVSLECRLTYTYPGDVKMIVGQQQKDIAGGTRCIGTKGEILVSRGKITSNPDSIVIDAQKDGGDEGLVELYRNTNHHQDFLHCIALRTGKKVQWDASEQRIINDDEIAKMSSREPCGPWTQS